MEQKNNLKMNINFPVEELLKFKTNGELPLMDIINETAKKNKDKLESLNFAKKFCESYENELNESIKSHDRFIRRIINGACFIPFIAICELIYFSLSKSLLHTLIYQIFVMAPPVSIYLFSVGNDYNKNYYKHWQKYIKENILSYRKGLKKTKDIRKTMSQAPNEINEHMLDIVLKR